MVVNKEKVTYHVSEAKKFVEAAMVEFERGEKEKSDIIIRDAAEKAWNAVLKATDALLLAKGLSEEEVKSHRARRIALASLGLKDPLVKAMGLRERFGAREYYLHERCFYDGEYLIDEVREEIQKAKEYVGDIASTVVGIS